MSEQEAAELAYGLLWMTETHDQRVHKARMVLWQAFSDDDRKERGQRGIEKAIALGYQADHPPNADFWAGKKDAV